MLLLILLVIILFGGGGYYGYGRSPYIGGGIGLVGLLLVVVLMIYILDASPV